MVPDVADPALGTPACLDCGTPVVGPFCAECGQHHAEAESLAARVTFLDLVDEVVQVNGRLAAAAVDLVFRPGLLTADYLAGRRARHPPPAKLFLVVNFVFFVAVQWFDPVPAAMISEIVGEGAYAQAEAASGLPADAFARSVEAVMADALAGFLVVLVPLLAVVLRVLFVNRRLGVVGHAVFGFHLVAFFLLSVLPGTALAGTSLGDPLLNVALLAALPLWIGVALHRAYGGAWAWTAARTAALWTGLIVLLSLYLNVVAGYALLRAG